MTQKYKQSIYASGAIEFSKDPDTWRNKMQKELKKEFNVIIPYAKFCPHSKDEEKYKDWIKENFIIPDIEAVMKSENLFVKIDPGVIRGSGTYGELTVAAYFNKSIVYMLDGVKETELPGWTLGCLTNAVKVESIEDAIKYYKSKGE